MHVEGLEQRVQVDWGLGFVMDQNSIDVCLRNNEDIVVITIYVVLQGLRFMSTHR